MLGNKFDAISTLWLNEDQQTNSHFLTRWFNYSNWSTAMRMGPLDIAMAGDDVDDADRCRRVERETDDLAKQ